MLDGARPTLWALLGKDFLSEICPWPLSPWVFSSCLSFCLLSWSAEPTRCGHLFGSLGVALGLLTAPEGFIEGLAGTVLSVHSNLIHLCPQPPGSVRRTSSPARTATASGVCGTVMVTMTVGTTVMSSVVSGGSPKWEWPWEELQGFVQLKEGRRAMDLPLPPKKTGKRFYGTPVSLHP